MMLQRFSRWLYRGRRPNALARWINRVTAAVFARGVAPNYLVMLEVAGRQSGRPRTFPLVMAVLDGERYLVSMLGADVAWVRNVHAAAGRAVLHHGRTEQVSLEEIAVEKRAPVIRAYLRCAPGARPHVPVDKDAPLDAFEAIAPQFPVFCVRPAGERGLMTDRSYVAENDRERRRLEALVGRLDDAALDRAMPAGWTVAAVLAHLAFWDQRIVLLCEHLKRGASVAAIDGRNVDWINDAAKPIQLALPARRAATLAVETAGAADQAVATLSDEQLTKNSAAGSPINLRRAEHRREHLDEIEHALARG